MKNPLKIIVAVFLILLQSCGLNSMSKIERDKSAGMNGSFEFVKSGLPVNWSFYAVEALRNGECILKMDTNEYKNGKQSLNFVINKLDSSHYLWKKPGFFQTYNARLGETYKLSFWIKNNNCEFLIRVSSEGEGMYSEKIIHSDKDIEDWKYVEYNYTVPVEKNFKNIRFEVNLLKPGSFWIDDINIEGLNDKGEMKEW